MNMVKVMERNNGPTKPMTAANSQRAPPIYHAGPSELHQDSRCCNTNPGPASA